MSVWSDPHYRSEPLIVTTNYLEQTLTDHKNVLALCNFVVDDYGDFPVPIPKGNLKNNILAGKANIKSAAYKFGKEVSYMFSDRFKRLPEPMVGIEAVYRLYSQFYNGGLALKREFDDSELKSFCTRVHTAFGPASYASPRAWEDASKANYKDWSSDNRESPLYWFQQAEAVRHLAVAQGILSYRRHCKKAKSQWKPLPWIDPKAIFGKKDYPWKCYRYRNITILESKTQSFLLLNKDLTRLAQLLESTGKIILYFESYADDRNLLSRKLVSSALAIISLIIKAIKDGNHTTYNSICRSMDIAQFIYLAGKAGPLAKRSLEAQLKKGFDGWYDKVFPLKDLLSILTPYRIREGLELASIRKMLPVPDFCIYSCMNNNYQMHSNPFPCIPHPDPETTFEDFTKYWRWSMIRNFYDRHKQCPGKIRKDAESKDWHTLYPRAAPITIPYQEVDDIDWESTFSYVDYSYAEHELRKDKVMAPSKLPVSMTPDELHALPIYRRNQIAHFFLDPLCANLKDLREDVLNANVKFDWVHLTALKPEAKKEGGRMFYMANDEQRVLMSEKEANVASYLRFKAGNSSGISDIDLARQMHEIAKPTLSASRKVCISFDLEKWSPRQNPKLKETAYEIWSYAFGLPHIKRLLSVHQKSRLAFMKYNIHHEYRNPGQDMEGYDAKTNTAMHIEVMSYAINVCRRLGLLKKGAKLLSLIDDGGMSLEFDLLATDQEIWDCIECIEQVYQMVGLRISWDKTFVSEKLFMYLNEVYYSGFKVTPGLKAFLRVGKIPDLPGKTIVDELDSVAGEIQGAVKAGTSYGVAYKDYCFEVYRIIKRWSRYRGTVTDAHIYMCLAPVALGGIGMRSLPQIVTNEAFNPLVAGIGNLKAFGSWYTGNTQVINQIIKTGVKVMNEEQFIRAPSSIRSAQMTLNTQRFAMLMQDWLLKNSRNPYVTQVLESMNTQSSTLLATRVKLMSTVSSVGLMNIQNMRPEAAIEALTKKFQRSQTAAEVLGFRTTLRVALANRFQAAQLIASYTSVVSQAKVTFAK